MNEIHENLVSCIRKLNYIYLQYCSQEKLPFRSCKTNVLIKETDEALKEFCAQFDIFQKELRPFVKTSSALIHQQLSFVTIVAIYSYIAVPLSEEKDRANTRVTTLMTLSAINLIAPFAAAFSSKCDKLIVKNIFYLLAYITAINHTLNSQVRIKNSTTNGLKLYVDTATRRLTVLS